MLECCAQWHYFRASGTAQTTILLYVHFPLAQSPLPELTFRLQSSGRQRHICWPGFVCALATLCTYFDDARHARVVFCEINKLGTIAVDWGGALLGASSGFER